MHKKSEIEDIPILTRILEIMDLREMDQKTLAEKAGMGASTISDWKAGKSNSYGRIIILGKFADALGANIEYLAFGRGPKLTGKTSAAEDSGLSEQERDILEKSRELTTAQKTLLLKVLETVIENGKRGKAE